MRDLMGLKSLEDSRAAARARTSDAPAPVASKDPIMPAAYDDEDDGEPYINEPV